MYSKIKHDVLSGTSIDLNSYIKTLEDLPAALESLFDDWDDLDEDLIYEYTEQLQWLLSKQCLAVGSASDPTLVKNCIINVNKRLFNNRIKIHKFMNVDVTNIDGMIRPSDWASDLARQSWRWGSISGMLHMVGIVFVTSYFGIHKHQPLYLIFGIALMIASLITIWLKYPSQ